jgi:peptide/nickel transport system substrate-binding protein
MKRTWFYTLLAVLVIAALLLSACGQQTPTATKAPEEPVAEEPTEAPVAEEPTEEPTEAPVAEEPAARKVVTIAWTQEPDSLNHIYTNMWYSVVLMQLWSCWAWEYDDNNEPYAHLVTEIPSTENGGVSEDGLVITLHLRDDIVWSDGTPITADDFIFTHEMIMDDANAVDSKYPYDYLESLEAPDPQTVVMTFAEPFAGWQAIFWHGVLPKHILQPVFEAEGSIEEAEWNLAPTVGCGPFVFDEWESGSFMRFVRNDNYWRGQAKLDEIVFQFVPDDASQTAACIAGDADVGYWPPYSDIPALQDAGLELIPQPSGYNEGWFFNFRDMASPAIRDVRVRQAIAMALDREAVARDLKLGLVKPNETFWDALPTFVDPDIQPWQYDPEAAKALLEEAGWTDADGDGIREDADGNPLTITQGNTTKEERQNFQAVAQQMLLEVGIDLQILAFDADILFGSYTEDGPAAVGDLDIMEWSDVSYFPDPDIDYWLCAQIPDDDNPWGYNYFGCDETLDGLFQRQLTTMDAQERAEIFHEITRYMHDNVYYLGIWEDPDIWIINPRAISGYKFSGVTPFYNIMEWDVTE